MIWSGVLVHLKGPGRVVPELDPFLERGGEVLQRAEHAAVQAAALDLGEPAFNLIDQLAEAQSIAPVVCIQNMYNIAHREDDALVDLTAQQGIAFVPYFPLGGFSPLQSKTLESVADRLGATPHAVALAWLLQRSPNILLIPGTSSVEHLHQNVAAASLELPADAIAELDKI